MTSMFMAATGSICFESSEAEAWAMILKDVTYSQFVDLIFNVDLRQSDQAMR